MSRSEPRRALSNLGGPVARAGDPLAADVLARALAAAGADAPGLAIHQFHTYPARMHPALARAVLRDLAEPGAVVLDPFCGGGTVPVEARCQGARALAVDLNPLAVRLARVRADPLNRKRRAMLGARAREVAERVRAAASDPSAPRHTVPRAEAAWYEPHVLAELGVLRHVVGRSGARWEQDVLLMVLSSIVVKVSRQAADTAPRRAPRRLRKGFVSELFVRRTDELARALAELERAVPRGTPPAAIHEGDARRLRAVLGRTRADLVLTSPPYGGTYDYVEHHARRYAWLGLDPRALRAGEIGARRDVGAGARERWDAQVLAVLRSVAAVVAPQAPILLLVGDAQLGRMRVDAAEQLARLAARAGLDVRASASQPRPDWRGGPPRREHLVWLER